MNNKKKQVEVFDVNINSQILLLMQFYNSQNHKQYFCEVN